MVRGDGLAFLGRFLRHPASVGAIAPSSQALAKAMVRGLGVSPEQTVVEFGPGTGPFTAALAELLPDPCCYLGIERDAAFVGLLRERFPKLAVVEGSAEHATQYLAQRDRKHVAAVICGLPFASLPPRVQDGVIAQLDAMLRPPTGDQAGGEFRTFQYVHAYWLPTAVRFRRRMDAIFGPGQIHATVLANLPPAYVLRWTRGAALRGPQAREHGAAARE